MRNVELQQEQHKKTEMRYFKLLRLIIFFKRQFNSISQYIYIKQIRQKMQGQINNLNEAFKHAQGRIKSLQGHVNYLKTSYSNIFSGQGQGEAPVTCIPGESLAPVQGHDSCDCNY